MAIKSFIFKEVIECSCGEYVSEYSNEEYWFECAKISLLTQYIDGYISEWQYDWLMKKLVCNV